MTVAPNRIDGLALWLIASSSNCTTVGDDQRVTRWADASGYGNDAMAENSGVQSPRLITGEANGYDVLRFTPLESASSYYLPERLVVPDDQSLHLAAGDFSVVLVGRYSNQATPKYNEGDDIVRYNGAGTFLAKQEHIFPYRGIYLAANYPGPFVPVAAQTRLAIQLELGGALAFSYSDQLNDGTLRVYGVRRRSTDVGLFVNGVREGGTSATNIANLSAVAYPLVLGGEPGQPLKGEVAEIVMVKGAISDADFSGLGRYLMQKYGLASEAAE